MKKLILILCFLVLIQNVQAENFKHRFMLTVKAGPSYLWEDYTTRKTYLGSEIAYCLYDQLSVGVNFDYSRYYKYWLFSLDFFEPKSEFESKWEWYSLTFYGKMLLSSYKFSPFVKTGIGFYIPRVVHYKYDYLPEDSSIIRDKLYGKTCLGFNFGMGVQYRLWERFCLQFEGLINNVHNTSKDISDNHSFTSANLDVGISIIF